MSNTISWYEIPCKDIERAARFYEAVTGKSLKREEFAGVPNAIFTTDDPASVGGALVQDVHNTPSDRGALVYLNAGRDLEGWIARTASAGGEVLLPKTDIGAPGFIAIVKDTEGNRVGFHAER
jgi:predicted enzyme related to lactoylglutathione lyase